MKLFVVERKKEDKVSSVQMIGNAKINELKLNIAHEKKNRVLNK